MQGKISLRTILLVVLAVFMTAFAFMNYAPIVRVWPFGSFRVIYLIALSFGMGIGVGILGHSLLGLFRSRPARLQEGMTLNAGEREHPGRP